MLISEALLLATNNLKQQGINSNRIDALLLLCHCLSYCMGMYENTGTQVQANRRFIVLVILSIWVYCIFRLESAWPYFRE